MQANSAFDRMNLPHTEAQTTMRALILVAEDERDIRDLLVTFLEIGGFMTVAVPNGQEAIKQAIDRRPDLILLDVRMPRMDGLQACAALKAMPGTCDIPVVFLSAYASKQDVEKGLAVGAERYLAKPIELEDLNQNVIEILMRGKKGSRRKLHC
jgi:two-component system phosphate regulon response regulator PhoB